MSRVLFVCMGNICRSPTAEAVLRKRVHESGLSRRVEIDSAGLESYHLGDAPDRRAQSAARQRGFIINSSCMIFCQSRYMISELVLQTNRCRNKYQ